MRELEPLNLNCVDISYGKALLDCSAQLLRPVPMNKVR
jgi:hypothetical protein